MRPCRVRCTVGDAGRLRRPRACGTRAAQLGVGNFHDRASPVGVSVSFPLDGPLDGCEHDVLLHLPVCVSLMAQARRRGRAPWGVGRKVYAHALTSVMHSVPDEWNVVFEQAFCLAFPPTTKVSHSRCQADALGVECSPLTNCRVLSAHKYVPVLFRRRHWSDAHRDERYDPLPQDAKFDFLIVSECLYQASHEAPLLAVLQVRYGWRLG